MEDERIKIVERWIKDDPASVPDKEIKIMDLKTEVVFKFFKGIDVENIKINSKNIKLFELEK
jgi:hypothetical protein